MKRHEFLLGPDGELIEAAKEVPKIRNYIENLPKTSITFNITRIGGLKKRKIKDKDILTEFAGAWRVPSYYDLAQENGRVFVNPYAYHANTYPDIVVECQCGTVFSVAYDDDRRNLRNEHSHEDFCKPWYRLEARAEMSRRREKMLERLGQMGWKSTKIGPRLGMSKNGVGQLARMNNTSMQELRDAYRKRAGNTYAHLVRKKEYPSTLIGEIYGHNRSTLGRWAYRYGDYPKLEPGGQTVTADD